jgi:hypothetical protein
VPARATIMEERSRNVTDAPQLVYIIIFMPTCGQKDILALKFHMYHVSEHVRTDFMFNIPCIMDQFIKK